MWKKDIYGYRLYKIRISISSSERSYWDFSENGTVNRLWSYRLWDVKGRINSKTTESVKEPTSFIFKGWHLANDTSEPNLSHVLRNKWGLSDILPNCYWFFCWYQQEIQQMSHLLHFNNHKPALNTAR